VLWPYNACEWLPLLIWTPKLLSYHGMVCCCRIWDCPTNFGCGDKFRGISWILEFEQHFCVFIAAHCCIDVEYNHMICKILCCPPLQMRNMARKSTKLHCLLRKRCSEDCNLIYLLLRKELHTWCSIINKFLVCYWFSEKHWWISLCQPSKHRRIHRSIEWPFIVRLSWDIVGIQDVSQH